MAAFDFPSPASVGQIYTAPTGQSYIYDGVVWNVTNVSPQAPVASDNPPSNPYAGQLWLRSTTGALYCWYSDPNSSQWIQIPGLAQIGEPYKFPTADMLLKSMALGVVGLNSKADGTGTDAKLWTDANNVLFAGGNGYHKFAGGLILQWGSVTSTASDYPGSFPLAFPNQALMMVSSIPADIQAPGTSIYIGDVQAKTKTSFDVRTRVQTAGVTAPATNCPVCFMAVGY